jgi:NADH:ubiquinone oxidoreductase subunit H
MSEYMGFWLAKVVVEMAVAAVLIVILLSIFFIGGWLKRKTQEK